MEKITVGIDVSKDRLDVAVRPSGDLFVVARTGAGLDELVTRLKVLKPNLIVLEATAPKAFLYRSGRGGRRALA